MTHHFPDASAIRTSSRGEKCREHWAAQGEIERERVDEEGGAGNDGKTTQNVEWEADDVNVWSREFCACEKYDDDDKDDDDDPSDDDDEEWHGWSVEREKVGKSDKTIEERARRGIGSGSAPGSGSAAGDGQPRWRTRSRPMAFLRGSNLFYHLHVVVFVVSFIVLSTAEKSIMDYDFAELGG